MTLMATETVLPLGFKIMLFLLRFLLTLPDLIKFSSKSFKPLPVLLSTNLIKVCFLLMIWLSANSINFKAVLLTYKIRPLIFKIITALGELSTTDLKTDKSIIWLSKFFLLNENITKSTNCLKLKKLTFYLVILIVALFSALGAVTVTRPVV